MEQTNKVFEGLKSDIMGLSDFMGKEKLYQDFHAMVALITPDKEIHADVWDRDESRIRNKIQNPEYKTYGEEKGGVELAFRLKQVSPQEIGLAPVDKTPVFFDSAMALSPSYQDEFSEVDGYEPSRDIMGGGIKCNCAVCVVLRKPKEIWQPFDYKVAEETVNFINEYIENNRMIEKKMNIKRTPEELKILTDRIKEHYATKSIDFIDEIKKSVDIRIKNDIKEKVKLEKTTLLKSIKDKLDLLKRTKEGKEIVKGLFGEEFKIFQMNSDSESEMEGFCKSLSGSTDIVDFVGVNGAKGE